MYVCKIMNGDITLEARWHWQSAAEVISPFIIFAIQKVWHWGLRKGSEKGNQSIARTQRPELHWQIKSMQIAYTTLQTYMGRYDRNI